MSKIERIPSTLSIAPRPQTTISKAEKTRTAIVNSALDFLWERPFREMTVDLLMTSAGYSRTAFYQHFRDLHELMETILDILQMQILDATDPWLMGTGDPVVLTREALVNLVHACYVHGPFLRAVTDATANDSRLEEAWNNFLGAFDDAACARIEADQKQHLIPNFDVLPVAMALNRLDAFTIINAFGNHPRSEPKPVQVALTRIWISTLYGSEWLESGSSDLIRK